ncbi:MAG: hypothetical protein N4A33_02160 [Bacteriovoracaceae bacterium]|jgi:hypothetical protein|nr:hypothetical protein [Bacteriovoracaceae bacterium]
MFKHIILTFIFSLVSSLAASITIPIEDKKLLSMPANDLVYNDQRIDSSEALDLKRAGIDISQLNPFISHLFKNEKLDTLTKKNYNNSDFIYLENKSSPTEIFRSYIADKNANRFIITASLDNHTNIIRAVLLRKLGFDIDLPVLKEKLTVNFRNVDQKKDFIANLSEQTLTSSKRWIIHENEKSVTLRHIILGPAKLNNVNLYLPVMSKDRQRTRRVFRSMLALYALTDFPESINKISWKIGNVFNKNISLIHPYAKSFSNTTSDDLKWIVRKLNNLSEQDLLDAIQQAKYPVELNILLLEKLKSRINSLSKKLLRKKAFNIDLKVSNDIIKRGKLIKTEFENTAINYGAKDEVSPYRFSQIFRLFSTQSIYNTLSNLLNNTLQRFLPGIYNNDAIETLSQKIADFRAENKNGGVLPVKLFSTPTVFGRLFATRNIVFGQYLGTNAPIQLVDSVGAEINLGMQGQITGLHQTILPGIGVNSAVSRTYSHVRAMPDIKTASRQKISKILVPVLMRKLGKIIKNEYYCSISKKPYTETAVIDDKEFTYIKYDGEDFKQEALDLRQKLVNEGTPSNSILLVKIDRTTLCTKEVTQAREESIKGFVKEFAVGETFIINDSIKLAALANVNIPLYQNLTFGAGADATKVLLRSLTLRKTETGMHITIQEQDDSLFSLYENLSFYMQIIRNSNQLTLGKAKSKIFNVKLEGISEPQQKKAIKVLRQILTKNKKKELFANYKSKDLDHKVKAKLHTFNLLFLKLEKLKMGQNLEVVIPNAKGQDFSKELRTKTFYNYSDYKRTGLDFHGFFNSILSIFTKNVSTGSSSQDPGKTFGGSSKKLFVSTEVETTKGSESKPLSRIEIIRSAWSTKNKRVQRRFTDIDQMFSHIDDYNPVDETILHGSTKLRSYDIRTTLIMYPNAIEEIQDKMDSFKTKKQKLKFLRSIKQKAKTGAKKVLRQINKLNKSFKSIKDKVKTINDIYKLLFARFKKSEILKLVGEHNFFALTRVTGFREKHHEGYLEYNSDTVGSYDTEYGTGPIDKISSYLGLSSFEIRALNYTPGM